MQPDDWPDVYRLPCPLPLIKAQQALARLAPTREERGDVHHDWIRKGGEPDS
jgi:tRNA 2-thiouridine synthesizing protein A